MDVQKKLDEIVAAVEGARSMPMSASCVVNRAELLAMLSEVRDALPDSLSQAQALLGDRELMVAEARAEAERIIASAHEQRGSLVSDTEIARRSQAEADRILAEALGSVDRGREKLLGRGPGTDEHGMADEEAPERTGDPEELRRRADAYVDAKLGAFETVLAKTLEAVGRGRQKLTGHRPIDELAAHMAAQDGLAAEGTPLAAQQSDAEYLAGLAGAHPEPVAQEQPAAYDYPQQPEYAPMAAEYGGYQQDPYSSGGYDAYGYVPQQVEYTDPAYGWQQQGYEHQIPQQHQPQDHHQQQPYQQHTVQPTGLDETSFFDTGLIDLDRLRELEQGR
jgi:vacuolar-type H+-ATPase subunit H